MHRAALEGSSNSKSSATTIMQPTLKQFRAHLLTVIADLADQTAGAPVSVTATFAPVCARLGAPGHLLPHETTWAHQIRLAGLSLCEFGYLTSTPQDQWQLTDLGRQAQAVLVTLDADGGSTSVLPHIENEHPYEDAYLRGLAVQQTPCFGAYVANDAACQRCPLAVYCVVALDARLAELAAQLDVEEAKARATANRTNLAHEQELSVNELLNLAEAEGEKRPGLKISRLVVATVTRPSSVCGICGSSIAQGAAALWSPELGELLHEGCRPVLEDGP